ncbi:hypothetical protein KVT40_005156 [Elsinoe batatas]|uniref:RRN7-type domain-containing protein n=1 Tax=Elsinoe batatas TaxID=2601811 RepID=A0A8K0L209_9PEZI|nr:hypothetical protein KVT40_005156 [Elsinoe batatas]
MECEISNCGSRQFQVGEDGFTYCSEGHRQSQTGLVTADDDEGLQPTGRKSVRKSQQEEDDTALTGREGFGHYLTCFQLILWKQARSFIEAIEAPPELESIVRDLWTLRLNALSDRLATTEDNLDAGSQMFSSQDEGSNSETDRASRQTDKSERSLLGVTDGLCLIYLAALLLRLPVLPVQLHHMVEEGDVLYYRAIKDLDKGMTPKLEGRYHSLFDPFSLLSVDRFRQELDNTLRLFSTVFGLQAPPLNHHLCLWRLISDLHLPVEIYAGTLRLTHLLDVNFSFAIERSRWKSRTLEYADYRLAALVVVTTKILFPTDGRERPPKKPTEPAALAMDWKAWASISRPEDHKLHSSFYGTLRTTEKQVMEMSDTALDQYLSWFETMFTEADVQDTHGRAMRDANFKRSLRQMFPVDLSQESNSAHHTKQFESPEDSTQDTKLITTKMRPVRVLAQTGPYEDINRPGGEYVRYMNARELPPDSVATILYREVAAKMGLSVELLCRSVFAVEKLMDRVLTQ